MSLPAGTRIGAYEVTAPIGEGGMGQVYRATDTRLKRQVAFKILPPSLATDPDRLARFQREAEVLASLNHPHIAAIYGIEESHGVRALVMELVEGEDLSEHIAHGPLPIAEALPIALQIAQALEAAHHQGIIHRDLKPANIKVRGDRTVKVLDFGLAKALDPASTPPPSATMSPTVMVPATQAGLILGTPAYMSPEQARGKAVDSRADIWAFGVVLFEMISGRRPFDGEAISDTLASVLKSEPDWSALPNEAPAAIRRLLRRCLQKDVRQRLQDIGDARLDIEDAHLEAPAEGAAAPVRVTHRERLVWAAAVGLTVIATAAVARQWSTREVEEMPEMRVELSTPASSTSHFALAPNGRMVVYSAMGSGGRQLWIRSLDGTPARALAGTDGAEHPFWSPDQRSVGFFANNKLKRVEVDGGPPQSLATVFTPAGGTWNGDGTILYVPRDSGGIFRVSASASAGDGEEVTPRQSPELATRVPQFLPNGRHFLFYAAAGAEPSGVFVGELGTQSVRRILSADGPALYGSGHLWFVRQNTLFAQLFNPSTHELSGAVSRVADNLGAGPLSANFSVSEVNTVAYRTGTGRSQRQLVWFDRSGKAVGTAGEEGMLLSNPSLSPDGRHVVVERTLQQNIDLWLLDLQRNLFDRFTANTGADSMGVWSPDGRRVVFVSSVIESGVLAIARVDTTGTTETLDAPSGAGVKIPCDWSLDGRFILYKQIDQAAGTTDLWTLPMSGDRTPVPVARSPHDERDGQFSPDGKWIAYESDETGRREIHIQPFPGPGPRVRVSTNGGTQVRWRRDGKEVFYIAPDQNLMAVAGRAHAGAYEVDPPVPLFTTRISPSRSISRQQYVVSPDGKSFLINTTEQTPAVPLTFILNWKGNRAATVDSAPR